jgi:hypothetical protein
MKNEGKTPNITEGYRHSCFAFISAIDTTSRLYKAIHYNRLLEGIREYFTTWTSVKILTVSDCISNIVAEFVPKDYFNGLDKDQKRTLLRTILISSIREFTKAVVQEYIGLIIDNHNDKANIDVLKEKMNDILFLERDKIFYKFLESSTGKNTELIDKNLALKLQQDLKRTTKENVELRNKVEELTKLSAYRTIQLTKLLDQYKSLSKERDTLKEELSITKEKVSSLSMHSMTNIDNVEDDDEPLVDYTLDVDFDNKYQSTMTSVMDNAIHTNANANANTNTMNNNTGTKNTNTNNPISKVNNQSSQNTIPIQPSKTMKVEIPEPSAPPLEVAEEPVKPKRRRKTELSNEAMDDVIKKYTKKSKQQEEEKAPEDSLEDKIKSANQTTRNLFKTRMGDEPKITDIY